MKSQILISVVLTALFGISTAFAVPNWMRVPRGIKALSDAVGGTPTTISHPTTVTVHPHAVRSTSSTRSTSPATQRSPKTPLNKDSRFNSWGGFTLRRDASSNANTDTRGSENPTSNDDGRRQTIYRRGVAGNPGAIIGIVLGCLAVLGLMFWVGVCCYNGPVIN